MIRSFKKIGLMSVVCAALLAGCGNSEDVAGMKLFRATATAAFKGKRAAKQPTVIPPQAIAQALGATTQPVFLVEIENRKAQALLLEIAKNGAYSTFATSERQTITFLNGMITSTRGLGDDLMSSDAAKLSDLVGSKQSGVAPYTIRFLNGEDITYAYTYQCRVTRGSKMPVIAGMVNTTATLMTADCKGDGPDLQNRYLVGANGQILGARQWIGNLAGYASSQALRL
ncbi:YjbF family lipoprotein [Pseudoprimorskyibacter insulae]|uniref:Lipoprotein GfcB n=1 Tax=Pseudoprimorskyibacter insulae TaxID=1695997 RepID=A0A2R8ATX7_9RHOB|nr:YjbF family lipoprotein [Pseudoprimorskyibacter insulae]SPF79430.1 hypothetical protein PRI8871_01226 [Pseudoprimorskyibacter insulae]